MIYQTMPAIASREGTRARPPMPQEWASVGSLKKAAAAYGAGISPMQPSSKENQHVAVAPAKACSGDRVSNCNASETKVALQRKLVSDETASTTPLSPNYKRRRSRLPAPRPSLRMKTSALGQEDARQTGRMAMSTAKIVEAVSAQPASLDPEQSFSDDWEPVAAEGQAARDSLRRRSFDCASIIAELTFDFENDDFEEIDDWAGEDSFVHPDWEPVTQEKAQAFFNRDANWSASAKFAAQSRETMVRKRPTNRTILARAAAELKRAARERHAEKKARRKAEAQVDVPAERVAAEIERVIADCYRLSREIVQCDELFDKLL